MGRPELDATPVEVAPRLLGTVLRHDDRAVRICEVEAYGGADDPASHAHRRRTDRNRSMFAGPGTLYVYFVYGMHWCANVVCGPDGTAGAVLLRGGQPLGDLDTMRLARPAARVDRDLCRGPARLCAALGIDGTFDGADLCDPSSPVVLVDDGWPPPQAVATGPRIGVRRAAERPWRFWISDDPHVSAVRPS
ncbi:MAG: DNA-3-methyladenine glycosylase [Acidimicrobiia bacterium]|nr:DNA-3-methyladenine glycosylase [Acidimicrobiia bacterium]